MANYKGDIVRRLRGAAEPAPPGQSTEAVILCRLAADAARVALAQEGNTIQQWRGLGRDPSGPRLFSYLQPPMDERPRSGRFILTGSADFALLQSLGQSLAGRTALLELLPLGLSEVRRFDSAPRNLFEQLWRGSSPAIYDRGLDPREWYPSYVSTYLERDVRSILNIVDLVAFRTFLRLCAGRSGQILNLSSLLGIQSAEQLRTHPLRGAVFETWVASELLKSRVHRGVSPSLSFYRDRKGLEIDILVESGSFISAVECKSGEMIAGDSFDALQAFAVELQTSSLNQDVRSYVIYGGDARQARTPGVVLPWTQIDADPR